MKNKKNKTKPKKGYRVATNAHTYLVAGQRYCSCFFFYRDFDIHGQRR